MHIHVHEDRTLTITAPDLASAYAAAKAYVKAPSFVGYDGQNSAGQYRFTIMTPTKG